MLPRQAVAASACRRVEYESVRNWRTRMITDEAYRALGCERRSLHHHYPSIECICT